MRWTFRGRPSNPSVERSAGVAAQLEQRYMEGVGESYGRRHR